jgi:hypothetical protein
VKIIQAVHLDCDSAQVSNLGRGFALLECKASVASVASLDEMRV